MHGTKNRNWTQPKFCANCGCVIRHATTDADRAIEEPCYECRPYWRMVADCESIIEQAKDRMREANAKLGAIATVTHAAFIQSINQN